MKSYRLLLLDSKGRLLGSRSMTCLTDGEAIALAKRESSTFALAEIWRGGHLIRTFTNPELGSISIEVCAVRAPVWPLITDQGHYLSMFRHRSGDKGGRWPALEED